MKQLWQKSPKRLLLVILMIAFLLGIAAGSWHVWPYTIYAGFVALVGLGLYFLLPDSVKYVFLFVSICLLGFVWANTNLKTTLLPAEYAYQGLARLESTKMKQPPAERLEWQLLEGPYKGKLVRAIARDFAVERGATVQLSATITPSEYLNDRGSGVVGTAKTFEVGQVIKPPGQLDRIRNLIPKRVGSTLPEPFASLAVGLLTGTNDDFDPHFRDDLIRTGTTHIVAVSGYNITIIALLIRRMLLRLGRWPAFWTTTLGVALFVLFVGPSPSVLRGACVAMLSLFALSLGRITHRSSLVIMSAVLLCLMSPLGMLFSISWQLSFLAFVGILFVTPLLTRVFRRLPLGDSLAETLGAESMVLPLSLTTFGTLSIVSPVVNTVVLLFTPMAMAASFAQTIIALAAPPLAQITAWGVYPFLAAIVEPIRFASSLSFSSINVTPTAGIVTTVAIWGILASLIFIVRKRPKHHVFA